MTLGDLTVGRTLEEVYFDAVGEAAAAPDTSAEDDRGVSGADGPRPGSRRRQTHATRPAMSVTSARARWRRRPVRRSS